ncbi:Hypothetical predicted protein [Olea europaea subsp. europaea]|uniref:Uncharacterized protein n=1 Tax=Olea europaea subsp. europaea TaxID=158383 RepID=A0A8S0USR2_OLEEU|nr:Hypothetical predicted protein [Olea europaea subsp. europaea]
MHAEIEWLLITENEEMKKKVHLFKVEKIALLPLEVANKENVELKAQRKVAYNEVLERITELYPQVDLATMKDEFLLAEPSTPVDDVEGSKGREGETKPQENGVDV